jgi:rod shape-determining protein MreC
MRNLIIFLWKHNFFILFLILEFFCASLIVQNNNFQRTSFINSSGRMVGNVQSFVNSITEYLNLRNANDALIRENAHLRSLLPNAFYSDSVANKPVYDTLHHQQYVFLTAKVINNTINRRSNYLMLNKGSLHGIRPEMGLLSSNGVVGIVKDVSPHYCTAMSILHKDSHISAKLSKTNHIGSIVWEGFDAATASLLDIPKNAPVHIGDTIVTSSYSSIFPEGVLIGTVKSFDLNTGDSFYDIKVNLSTNFYALNYVYVVENLYKDEQRALEDSLRKHDR